MTDCEECSSEVICTKCKTGKVLNKAGSGCVTACTEESAFLNVETN